MTRRHLAIACALCAGALLCLSSLRWVDDATAGVVPTLQAAAPWAAASATVLSLVALVLHRRLVPLRVLAFIAAANLVLAVALAPGSATPPVSGSESGAAQLTVTSANTEMSSADAARLLKDATDVGTDVLVLLEADRSFVKKLDALGGRSTFPYRRVSSDDPPSATAVLSTLPLEDAGEDDLAFVSWDTSVDVDGGPIRVRAVHVAPPLLGLANDWRDDLGRLDDWVREVGGPTVIAGDFNASSAHPGFSGLCRGDSAMSDCGGIFARPTWAIKPALPSVLPLDHILTRDLKVDDAGSFPIIGSDHRAIWKRLRSSRV